ncbi:MAG: Stp1/IreP family PP2C-type Ser/Thr phosphatase, partial [Pseudomonadales bacterium]
MSLASKVEIVQKTDTGLRRDHNEDSVGIEKSIGLAILADGMGGHNSGEIASAMTVAHVLERFRKSYKNLDHGGLDWESGLTQETILLQDAIKEANQEIYNAAQSSLSNRGMGTTAVGMLFLNNKVSIAHVGDSRAYRLRDGSFELLTEDHSLLQELIRKGFYTREEARQSDQKNVITRALGIDPRVTVDIAEEITDVGDIYLACSDGLTDMVSDNEIHRILQENDEDIETAADELVLAANENGGKDNISVILARVVNPFPLEESFADKML